MKIKFRLITSTDIEDSGYIKLIVNNLKTYTNLKKELSLMDQKEERKKEKEKREGDIQWTLVIVNA